jgi:carnitine-CoA ligase
VDDVDVVLPALVQRLAMDQPDGALVEEVEGAARSRAELHEAALRWASLMADNGVRAGDPVVTLLPNCAGAFEVWLGTAWLRAIEVPINSMYLGAMLTYVVNQSQARVAVVAEAFLPALVEVAATLSELERVLVVGSTGQLAGAPFASVDALAALRTSDPHERPAPGGHDIACMIYTSGTTGPSKGVLMPWRELHAFAAAPPPDHVTGDGAYYMAMPVFHASGKAGLHLAALARTRLVMREHFSAGGFWEDVRRHHCTSAGMVGVMALMLLGQPPRPDDADNPLRSVMLGPLFAEIDEFCRRFGVRVTTGYGMTEIGAPLGAPGYDVSLWQSCGTVRPGYDLRIVDEHDEPVPAGEVGELVVRSHEPWLLNAGYWQMPKATAAAWRNGWFHTGDGFRCDDAGNFFFTDRLKDSIRRRGENISSLEVEALITVHPDVAEVAAFGVDADLGEQEVMAVVVRTAGSDITADQLVAELAPTMPTFMVPRYVEFTDALPRTPTFRVRKVELRQRGITDATWDGQRRTARV